MTTTILIWVFFLGGAAFFTSRITSRSAARRTS
jgi:hypothetical protein